jgi:hypothetical protein
MIPDKALRKRGIESTWIDTSDISITNGSYMTPVVYKDVIFVQPW